MYNLNFILFLFLLVTLNSCKKKEGCTDINSISYDKEVEKNNGTCIYGGDGGSSNVLIYLSRYTLVNGQVRYLPVHSKAHYLDSAYVLYNSIKPPGNYHVNIDLIPMSGGEINSYSKIYVGNIGSSAVNITGLKIGKYYIYVTGQNDSIPSQRVSIGSEVVILEDNKTYTYHWALNKICCVF